MSASPSPFSPRHLPTIATAIVGTVIACRQLPSSDVPTAEPGPPTTANAPANPSPDPSPTSEPAPAVNPLPSQTRPDTTEPPPQLEPFSADDLPIVNDRLLDRLQHLVPFTEPDSRDARDPYVNARRFLTALSRDDYAMLRESLHPQSPFVLGGAMVPDVGGHGEPRHHLSCWSVWRADVGRHLGLESWGFPDPDLAEIVVFLRSPADRPDVTAIRMRPDFTDATNTAGTWRVYLAERLLDPQWLCPASRVVYRRLDRTVTRPEFTGHEAVREPLPENLDAVLAQLVNDVRGERLDAVRKRLISADEWRESSPPCIVADGPPGGLPTALLGRLQRACLDTNWLGTVILGMHRLADSDAVFVHALIVFGRPGEPSRVFTSEWRTIAGALKLADLRPTAAPSWVASRLPNAPR